jgi:NAD(P)-dependent dehydrogenase (short-subunit alcohol dehydrogenase family)
MNGDAARRVVWITGAGKGIGRALAHRYAADGWTVAASARTEGDLLALQDDCASGTIRAFPLDITDSAAVDAAVTRIEEELGPIDLAILNAGNHRPLNANDFDIDVFRTLVETNLMGTVNCLAPLVPRLIERESGHIAVVASLAGYRGLPTAAAYGATKAGVINMCESLRPDLAQYNVRLSLINPGFVRTPLTDQNDFPMPFLISAEKAAEYVMQGLRRNAFETAFPWRFAVMMKALKILPDRLFFALTRRMIGK